MNMLQREELIQLLPYARRYARALIGSQVGGDALVAEALRRVPADAADARIALYTAITQLHDVDPPAEHGTLGHRQRQLLLLVHLEDLALDDAATILGIAPPAAETLLEQARAELRAHAATDVLIIEDEPIIALDIEELVQSCGHRVVGVAASEAEAVAIARRHRPGLILADINLGGGGDGAAAVARILRERWAPVIFVTAYPERLLTGVGPEPAFVISKPFHPMTLAIATFQAVTGGLDLA
jgi:CheY-like chemotaxis protein